MNTFEKIIKIYENCQKEVMFKKIEYLYNNFDPHIEIIDSGYREDDNYGIYYNIRKNGIYVIIYTILDLYKTPIHVNIKGYRNSISYMENFINKQIRLTKIRNIK